MNDDSQLYPYRTPVYTHLSLNDAYHMGFTLREMEIPYKFIVRKQGNEIQFIFKNESDLSFFHLRFSDIKGINYVK